MSETPEPGRGTSLYVHVPFCVVKCGYCDFNSYTVDDASVLDRFLVGLDAELAMVGCPRQPVSVFVGGGTPSFLDRDRLARMFEILGRHVDLRGCPEVTMEANPESIDREKAALSRDAGVTRISMGAQSFHGRHLAFLDRVHDGDRIGAAVAELRAAGCDNVSLDLMFALPGQTVAEWNADLDTALELRPDHLSCYNLTFEPGTRLQRDLRDGRVEELAEEAQREMFLLTRRRLSAAGFRAYEVSNFAGRGGPCRHNDHYWLQGDYVGVGPGASSHRAGQRGTNLKAVGSWAASVEQGVLPTASAELLTPQQRASEALWLGVRRTDGVDLTEVGRRLDLPVSEWFGGLVDRQVRDGLVALDAGRLRLTEKGLLFTDAIGADYLATHH